MNIKQKIIALAIVATMSLAGCGTQQVTPPAGSEEPPIISESMPKSEVVEPPASDVSSREPSSASEVDMPEDISSSGNPVVDEKSVESKPTADTPKQEVASKESSSASEADVSEDISSSSSHVVDEKPAKSKPTADTPKQEETPPVVGSANTENKNHPYGSEEHRQYIYETEWLNEENKGNTQFFDTFDEYYDNYYVIPFAEIGTPHIKTQDERDTEAKQLREERMAARVALEESAMQNIQSHWTEVGKTQEEIDARKAEWKTDMKNLYDSIDAKEEELLSQGFSLSEVEFEIGSMESIYTYGSDSGQTPEEAKAFQDAMNQGFDPIDSEPSAE